MKKTIAEKINSVLYNLNYTDEFIDINLSTPKSKDHGDLSTNVSFILSKQLNKSPVDIANNIKNELIKSDLFKNVNVAGNGFINFNLNPIHLNEKLKDINKLKNDYGKSSIGKNKKVLVEFVSANPTGPLTVGHGRGAIVGDIVSNIFHWNGYKVEREYYYNNAGRQMRILGDSVKARYFELIKTKYPFPEDGYQGEYIKDIANTILESKGDKITIEENDLFLEVAEKYIFSDINKTLDKIGIQFDSFFNENTLYKNKDIYKVIDRLRDKGLVYDKDEAVWFHGTKVGRDNDRVLIKKTGEPTYRLPDMAYHINKIERGYNLCIDIFGADHMDAYPDVIEVVKQLGYNQSKIKVLIHQFISILKNGKQIKMSTRKATFITLDELINEVGIDVVRYFFIMRNINSHLNFDLEVAKEKSEKNPIYYIQYAYARIMTIQTFVDYSYSNADLALLDSDEEIKIISKLFEFEELIIKLSDALEPQLLATYLFELAAMFHKYYAKFRIINKNKELSKSRLVLIDAVSTVIKNGLNILGISSPKTM